MGTQYKRLMKLGFVILVALLLLTPACASKPAPAPSPAPAPAPAPVAPPTTGQPASPPVALTEITGVVAGLGGNQIVVEYGSKKVTLDFVGNTQIELANGQPGSKNDLKVGSKVQVQYTASILVAAKIKILP